MLGHWSSVVGNKRETALLMVGDQLVSCRQPQLRGRPSDADHPATSRATCRRLVIGQNDQQILAWRSSAVTDRRQICFSVTAGR